MTQSTPESIAGATITMNPIGIVRSCFSEKFGIPRQPGLVPAATGTIELYDWISADCLQGLEQFSHLWIFFRFHHSVERGWKPRVRPPRLGGNKKVGVLASRSPQRPNFMGQSVVCIDRIDQDRGIIHISGLDLLDRTPVIDIKPYIPYTDSVPRASDGYASKPPCLDVIFTPECQEICARDESVHNRNLCTLIRQVLQQDPRPAYHKDDRSYGMRLWDMNIRFTCTTTTINVTAIDREPLQS